MGKTNSLDSEIVNFGGFLAILYHYKTNYKYKIPKQKI